MKFCVVKEGSNDYRLLQWDGTTETELSSYSDPDNIFQNPPTNRTAIPSEVGSQAADYYGDHVPFRDLTISDETKPW